MNQAEREFLEELRRDFVPEAEEYLQTIVSGLLALEKSPASSSGVIEEVFRAAHSLKGAAQAVQMPGVSSICQVVESVFSGMKKGVLHLSEGDFDILQRAADTLSAMIGAPEK
nr:Hpt domain-containing protein [Synergistaceae bacterium]